MSSKMKLKSKVGTLADIEKFIKPGDFVAIGGGWSCNKPMAIVREIIRQKINRLNISNPISLSIISFPVIAFFNFNRLLYYYFRLYFPVKAALRFSRKAAVPSFESWVIKVFANCVSSLSTPLNRS